MLIEHLSSEEIMLIQRSKTTAALLLVPGALFTVTYLILYKRSLAGHVKRFFGGAKRADNTVAPS